jgi:hypothetical protein
MKYVELKLHSISISIWDFVKDNNERRILSKYKDIYEYGTFYYYNHWNLNQSIRRFD